MAPLDPDNATAVRRSSATDASNAISRMRSAPAYFSDEDWQALASACEPLLVGNAKGVLPENLEEDDDEG